MVLFSNFDFLALALLIFTRRVIFVYLLVSVFFWPDYLTNGVAELPLKKYARKDIWCFPKNSLWVLNECDIAFWLTFIDFFDFFILSVVVCYKIDNDMSKLLPMEYKLAFDKWVDLISFDFKQFEIGCLQKMETFFSIFQLFIPYCRHVFESHYWKVSCII